jgi:hypothetical protein
LAGTPVEKFLGSLFREADHCVMINSAHDNDRQDSETYPPRNPDGSGIQALWNRPQQMIQDPTLEREGQKSEESEYRHFENFPFSKKWHRIVPFGSRPEIPKLPHQTAGQASQHQAPQALSISAENV